MQCVWQRHSSFCHKTISEGGGWIMRVNHKNACHCYTDYFGMQWYTYGLNIVTWHQWDTGIVLGKCLVIVSCLTGMADPQSILFKSLKHNNWCQIVFSRFQKKIQKELTKSWARWSACFQGQPITAVRLDSQPITAVRLQSQPITEVRLDSQPITAVRLVSQPITAVRLDSQPAG